MYQMKFSLLLLFVFFVGSIQAAQVIRYVNTDSNSVLPLGDGTTNATEGVNRAYPTLFDAEAALQTNLDSDNNYMTITCYAPSSVADANIVTIAGWTTSTTDYLEIIPGDDKYVLSVTNAVALKIQEDNVRVSIDVTSTETGTGTAGGIVVELVGITDIRIFDCKVTGICSGTGAATGILINDTTATVTLYNTIISGFISGGDTGFYGLNIANGLLVNVYNCTITDNYRGVYEDGTATNMYNCAIFNNTDDFYQISGLIHCDYCASDDADPNTYTNGINWANEATDWAANFTNYAGGDFTVKDTAADIYNAGTDDPGSGLYSADIVGTTRTTLWDIGAYEYVVSTPSTAIKKPQIINKNMN